MLRKPTSLHLRIGAIMDLHEPNNFTRQHKKPCQIRQTPSGTVRNKTREIAEYT